MIKQNTEIRTILAIESSLDDTCAAVTIEDRVVSNVVSSQTSFHEEYGGTVPHIAKRMHQKWLVPTVKKALSKAGIEFEEAGKKVDAVAVTYGPGLAPCLEEGILVAKELAEKWQKPLLAVNHLEGHLLSFLAHNSKGKGGLNYLEVEYPLLGFLISGGHTELVLMRKWREYELLGETLDDAAGEAYDKVARMLNLGYPGGPILAELALEGEPKYELPIPMRERQDLNFSFSGLKTAAKYALEKAPQPFSREFTVDFAASFQETVVKALMLKFEKALEKYQPKTVSLGGGVVSNERLRTEARKVARAYGARVHVPYSKKLFTDNAAMIGVVAWFQVREGELVDMREGLDRKPNLNFEKIED